MGLVSSGQPVPRCAWRANKKLVENPLSPHRNNPTPHNTTDIVFCTLKKSRHRKRANIPTRANTAKRAITANRANTRKKKKSTGGHPRLTCITGKKRQTLTTWDWGAWSKGKKSGISARFRFPEVQQNPPPRAIFCKGNWDTRGMGTPLPNRVSRRFFLFKTARRSWDDLIRGRLQGTDTRLLYRALRGTFHHSNAASPPFRPWLCNLLTEWVLHRHYVPNGGEPKLPPAVLVSL